jgi:glutamate-1-semialdehyde 2,1-aminomutase
MTTEDLTMSASGVGDRYRSSRAQHQRAELSLAGGVATAFRAGQRPVPITFERGAGSRLWDIDGNEYVDYALAFGPMLLGHDPAPVISSVSEQLRRGIGFGASHRLEAELAEAICRTVPSAELCVFNSTGSEAVHAALRIARAATGRRTIIKFRGHYHGWFDPIHIGVSGSVDGPGTDGQDPEASASVRLCDWDDLPALEGVLGNDVAAIIMEPIAVNGGCFVASPGYLEKVRTLADEIGAVLIFDEVITGYRVALGGAQQRLGIKPDLTILGKALGAGFPISAVCGRADVMEVVSTAQVAHVGTFNANPICASAALAAVISLERDAAEVYPRLDERGDDLAQALAAGAAESGLAITVNNVGAAAYAFVAERPVRSFADLEHTDDEAYRQFAAALLAEGVHVIPRGLLYVSTEHSREDVSETLAAARRAAARVTSQ